MTSKLLPNFSQRREWASRQAISFLMRQGVENPGVISLAAGLVDPSTLPVDETRLALQTLLGDDQLARQALQYGTTAGLHPLRELLLDQLARQEKCSRDALGVDADRLVLTTGSQQLLSLVAEMLFDPGDICLAAAPTYFVFLGVLEGVGARVVPIEADENGIRIDKLDEALSRIATAGELQGVKLAYLVSYYENPSGVSLSTERRKAVLDVIQKWSRRQKIYVLEDAAYRELRYDGEEHPSVWSFDESRENVILAQTFSKSFSPGVRVGFGVLPPELVAAICDRKGNEDFGSSNFGQHLLAAVLRSGRYQQHLQSVRDSYRGKRDAMLAAIQTHFQDITGVQWISPHGGLYVWMTLPASIPTSFDSPLFLRATKTNGVMYVPGELCYPRGWPHRPANQMRLSFGVESEERIAEGILRLSRAVRHVQESEKASRL